ncbi:DUF2937 family protein [Microvirga tunisiensis]|uniref:DUF2937 family protein n=2 Tax=Pannonibacter tanglangensis TaxID=2750084 RepID=A0A7X5F735_9HYPH|nr:MULTISPECIES: DUF2937 family protein [unclassified Pannonibacter]NBN65349.1 DUF2937 family protein [Pannonibacter sp. XCT-34]NBN79674.1 DUF2937 family protein [Pannonibacter sp. XCT-53]
MLARPFALAVGLMAGVVSSQLPEFAQQYRQRLGGAIDALQLVMAATAEDAARNGLDVDGALEHLKRNPDPLVAAQGRSLEEMREKLAGMRAERDAYERSDAFGQMLLFLTTSDPDVVRGTYEEFRPAVPATAEGFVTALLGGLAGVGALRLIGAVLRGLWRVLAVRPG